MLNLWIIDILKQISIRDQMQLKLNRLNFCVKCCQKNTFKVADKFVKTFQYIRSFDKTFMLSDIIFDFLLLP